MAVAGRPLAEEIRWINGKARQPGIVERICPGRHVTSDQWKSEWNHDYLNAGSSRYYDYISDYECFLDHPIKFTLQTSDLWKELQDEKRKGTSVNITDIAHFTDEDAAEAIKVAKGFSGGQKKIDKRGSTDIEAMLSWWSPIFPNQRTVAEVRNRLQSVMNPFLGDYDDEEALKQQFATSHAFKPNKKRYGSCFFKYDIKELCKEYKRCCKSELDFRILGTFGYKQEVEHVVLVCSGADGISRFRTYPQVKTPADDIATDSKAVVTRDTDGTWTWKPEATATEIVRLYDKRKYPMYRRWDHVSFAFHIPENWNVMKVRHLEAHAEEL